MGLFKKKNIEFPKSIIINDATYSLNINLVEKKNSSVVLRKKELFFRISSYLSNKQKIEHFYNLLEKMRKKITKMPKKKESLFVKYLQIGFFEFANETFLLLQKNRKSIGIKGNSFQIPKENWTLSELEKGVSKLLAKRFEARMKEYVIAINMNSYNYAIKDVKLSYVGSKWGHCTHDNVIMINIKLLMSQKEVMDYVIYHELSHIKEKNHSSRFWAEVEKFCPNYKKLRKFLKNNPPELF